VPGTFVFRRIPTRSGACHVLANGGPAAEGEESIILSVAVSTIYAVLGAVTVTVVSVAYRTLLADAWARAEQEHSDAAC